MELRCHRCKQVRIDDTESSTVTIIATSAVPAAAIDVLRHAAETGGGPTGFGWASFVTFAVGAGVVLYAAGQLVKAVHARRMQAESNRDPSDDDESGAPGGTRSRAS